MSFSLKSSVVSLDFWNFLDSLFPPWLPHWLFPVGLVYLALWLTDSSTLVANVQSSYKVLFWKSIASGRQRKASVIATLKVSTYSCTSVALLVSVSSSTTLPFIDFFLATDMFIKASSELLHFSSIIKRWWSRWCHWNIHLLFIFFDHKLSLLPTTILLDDHKRSTKGVGSF